MTIESAPTPTPPPLSPPETAANAPTRNPAAVSQLADELSPVMFAELQQTPDSYLESLHALTQAQRQAEELTQENLNSWVDDPDLESPAEIGWTPHPQMDRDGMPLDKQHPIWMMMDDDSITTTQVLSAIAQWRTTLTSP